MAWFRLETTQFNNSHRTMSHYSTATKVITEATNFPEDCKDIEIRNDLRIGPRMLTTFENVMLASAAAATTFLRARNAPLRAHSIMRALFESLIFVMLQRTVLKHDQHEHLRQIS
jgi:hypothetical protein